MDGTTKKHRFPSKTNELLIFWLSVNTPPASDLDRHRCLRFSENDLECFCRSGTSLPPFIFSDRHQICSRKRLAVLQWMNVLFKLRIQPPNSSCSTTGDLKTPNEKLVYEEVQIRQKTEIKGVVHLGIDDEDGFV
ncbi:unnamed protein product [Lactuca virosa]|uniref:Uncharacterized protein n=1 Tax=Lactuca virosa TaxID=75947 RepID=A0AAU9PUL3_9ASTR|nr:unnamed protein product [Lactuca virosa]